MISDTEKAKAADLRKLKKMLKLVPVEQKPIGEKLVAEIVFMTGTLAELKKTIEEKGVVDNFKQGKQQFMRESPALKAYNATIQRYSLVCKQFVALLPKPEPNDKAQNELLEFLKNM